jgi:hypothetical protein
LGGDTTLPTSRTGAAGIAILRAKPPSSPGSPSSAALYLREEFETLDEAREKIGACVDGYHQRRHSRLAYRTPR